MIYPNWPIAWPYILAAVAVAYLIGSIPFGLVLTRIAGLGDVRRIGSGNIGATNVLRTGNKPLAAATLLLDGGKGTFAVAIGGAYWGPDIAIAAALGVLVGHLFPVWLRFKGGKGVATGLGILLALAWPVGIAACLTWLAVAGIFRYSSLSALAAFAAAPVFAWWLADPQAMEFAAFMAVVIWLTHAGNIRRLVRGEESRIGKKS
jgi:glycerol-3-phosphate acyltransferase PlsY